MPKIDIHQHVTDTIVAQIEAGTASWRNPWTGTKTGVSMPMRYNGEPYRGVNVLMLWAMAMDKGYNSDRWMTFKQAIDLGGCVRKGEKSAKSVYYGTFEKETEGGKGETETQTSRFAKAFSVFNADQIDGLPEEYYVRPDPPRDLGTQADPALDAFFAGVGVPILTTDEPRAYYSIRENHIHMPPIATFYSAAGYYGVLGHEEIHASGSKSRLDRFEKFQDRAAYAFEELVAEIGACFLAVQLGVEPQFEQSASYVENWLTAIKGDNKLIFKAASEAQKAVDDIMARASMEAAA